MKKNMESAYNCMDKHKLGSETLALQPHHIVAEFLGWHFSLWFLETTNIRTRTPAKLVCFAAPKYTVKGDKAEVLMQSLIIESLNPLFL